MTPSNRPPLTFGQISAAGNITFSTGAARALSISRLASVGDVISFLLSILLREQADYCLLTGPADSNVSCVISNVRVPRSVCCDVPRSSRDFIADARASLICARHADVVKSALAFRINRARFEDCGPVIRVLDLISDSMCNFAAMSAR